MARQASYGCMRTAMVAELLDGLAERAMHLLRGAAAKQAASRPSAAKATRPEADARASDAWLQRAARGRPRPRAANAAFLKQCILFPPAPTP